jgi:glycosyltransferase involved in cell wall biosynthesis
LSTPAETAARLPVLLDARAALLGRPGGWERCTRELAELSGDVVTVAPRHALPRGVATAWEWTTLPALAARHELTHFPAFPPTPAVPGRVVYTLHDLVWWRYPETTSGGGRWYYRRLAARSLRSAHVVTVSQAVADEIVRDLGVPAKRVDVIPPGVRAPGPGVVPEVRDRPYLLTVGAIEPRKNLDRLLRAWGDSGAAADADLLLVGRQAWGRLPDGALHLGAVTDERLQSLYRGATAVVSASLYEGFGLPVAEALAAGRPVVCSDIPSFREVAGDNATFVDPYDVPALARALRVAVAGALAPPMAGAAAQFSWERFARDHHALYERLLDSGS